MIRQSHLQKLKKIFLFLSIILVFGYGIFTARDAIFGVKINLDNDKTSTSSKDPIYKISGKVNHAEEMTMNGLPIAINEKGFFDEVVILSPGYNSVSLIAKNKFKKYDAVELQIVLE